MNCKHCKHWNMRNSEKMAEQGLAICELRRSKAYFKPFNGGCARFAGVDAEQAGKRNSWLAKKGF